MWTLKKKLLSSIAIVSLFTEIYVGWAIGLRVDDMSSLQPCSVSKGCQYVHGLIKIALAKILNTNSLSIKKKTQKLNLL